MGFPAMRRECPRLRASGRARDSWQGHVVGLQFRAWLHIAQHTKQLAGICSQALLSPIKWVFFYLCGLKWEAEKGMGGATTNIILPQQTEKKKKMFSKLMTFSHLPHLQNHNFLTSFRWTEDPRHSSRVFMQSCSPKLSSCRFIWG